MASDTDAELESESVRIVATLMCAFDNSGYGGAVAVMMSALADELGVERAACLWDAACCRIQDHIDRMRTQETSNGE